MFSPSLHPALLTSGLALVLAVLCDLRYMMPSLFPPCSPSQRQVVMFPRFPFPFSFAPFVPTSLSPVSLILARYHYVGRCRRLTSPFICHAYLDLAIFFEGPPWPFSSRDFCGVQRERMPGLLDLRTVSQPPNFWQFLPPPLIRVFYLLFFSRSLQSRFASLTLVASRDWFNK